MRAPAGRMPPLTEADWQTRVVALARRCHWTYYHTYDSRRSPKGFPDLVFMRGDRLIFAELKSAGGGVTSAQRVWVDGLSQVRHLNVYVWRPGDWREVQEVLR